MLPALSRGIAAASLICIVAPVSLVAQQRVEYEISFPNAVHHEAEVVATFHGVPAGRPLQVRMSRTSPGRYALHEFAKNVYNVRVADGRGRPLTVTRPDPHQWDVAGHDGTVRVSYTLFGDRGDGTYAQVDASHAHLNIPATFVFARGWDAAPVRVTFRKPAGWSIATQLVPTADSLAFTAPNLQYFMDSPTEIGPLAWRTWEVRGPERAYTVRMAVHHLGTEAQLDTFAEMARKVVAEQVAVFGEPARYDFGAYTFIVDYLPWASGDGMEHRNSTIVTGTRPLAGEGALRNLGTVSHEFFHSWNVERIRPASLEPFRLEEANMSGELWFAEGFTSYYDGLFIRRAGLWSDDQLAEDLDFIVHSVVTAPGRRYFSAVEMSMQAPFVDAAVSIDPNNRGNTFLSYYTWGSGIGLGLDLALRERFPNVTLDDFMREVWRRHGREQTPALAPARPYTIADLRRILGEVTGDKGFADDFFARYIEGREAPDYERLLGRAGFLVRKFQPGRPWLGAPQDTAGGAVLVSGYPAEGGSLYRAGVSRGARIHAVNGTPTPTPEALRQVMEGLSTGQTVEMDVEQRGTRGRVRVALVENPALEVVTYERAGRTVTPEMREVRSRWLGSRAR